MCQPNVRNANTNETKIGQAYSINTDATYPYKPPRYGQYGEGKAIIEIKNQKR